MDDPRYEKGRIAAALSASDQMVPNYFDAGTSAEPEGCGAGDGAASVDDGFSDDGLTGGPAGDGAG